MDDVEKKVSEVNPAEHKLMLELEVAAGQENTQCTFVWTYAYGGEVWLGECMGFADAMSHCMRGSMTESGWIAGPHRFTPDRFIVVAGRHSNEIRERILVPLIEAQFGPRIERKS